jgi:hypothetical protein
MHNVNIVDNNANWLAWGNLVLNWVNGTQATPQTVSELRAQMAAANPPAGSWRHSALSLAGVLLGLLRGHGAGGARPAGAARHGGAPHW